MTAIPDSTPTYDRRGNLTQRAFSGSQMWYYTYDHENQLTRVQTDDYYTPEANRWKVEFTYDGQGRLRVKKDYVWYSGYGWYPAGETRYLYDGLLLVQERNSANTPTVTYTRGRDLSGSLAGAGGIGGLLARSHGYSGGNWSSHTAYHADGNGNVTALVNSSGTLQASYRYDPYGRYLAGGGTLAGANVLRFSSKPWVGFAGSATSGLYYYGYRFYDPYLQRWVNRDPIGERGDNNLFRFVNCNPLNHSDSSGLFGGPIMDNMARNYNLEETCEERIFREVNSSHCGGGRYRHRVDNSCRQAHCIANCRIKRECPLGAFTAALASWWKEHYIQGEWRLEFFLGGYGVYPSRFNGWDPIDSPGDMAANREGRRLATCINISCENACKDQMGKGYPLD